MRPAALGLALGLGLVSAAAAAPPTLCDGAIARAVLDFLGASAAWPWPASSKEPPAAAYIGSGPPPPGLPFDLGLLAEATWRGSPELPRTALAPGNPAPGKPVGYFPGPAPAGARDYLLVASGDAALAGLAEGSLSRAELPTPLFRILMTNGKPGAAADLVVAPAPPVRFGIWVARSSSSALVRRVRDALDRFDAHPTGDAVLVALGADRFRIPRPGPERPPRP